MIWQPRSLSRHRTRLVIVERDDGEHYRGHLAGVYADHIVLRAAEWLEQPLSGEPVPRAVPGEYVILRDRIRGIQMPPTTA